MHRKSKQEKKLDLQETNRKQIKSADLCDNITTILNVNGLNTPIKR